MVLEMNASLSLCGLSWPQEPHFVHVSILSLLFARLGCQHDGQKVMKAVTLATFLFCNSIPASQKTLLLGVLQEKC